MKKLLNKEIVQQAITDIKAAGDKPTIERIRKITGGSPKTIIAIKRLINDSEYDSNNDNKISFNDNEHNSNYGSQLSLNDIETLIDTRINQRLNQTNTDNTTQQKKLEAQNAQLKRDLLTVKNEVSNDLEELDLKRKQVEKLKTDNEDLTQLVERLRADYEHQEHELKNALANAESLEAANEKQAKELKIALENVDRLATENVELRKSVESTELNGTGDLFQPKLVDTTEIDTPMVEPPEPKNELKVEPTKLINPTTKERCFELFEYGHRQKDIIDILDNEGLKNAAGNKLGGGTVSKWHTEWEKDK